MNNIVKAALFAVFGVLVQLSAQAGSHTSQSKQEDQVEKMAADANYIPCSHRALGALVIMKAATEHGTTVAEELGQVYRSPEALDLKLAGLAMEVTDKAGVIENFAGAKKLQRFLTGVCIADAKRTSIN
jgi:hypothetical protein